MRLTPSRCPRNRHKSLLTKTQWKLIEYFGSRPGLFVRLPKLLAAKNESLRRSLKSLRSHRHRLRRKVFGLPCPATNHFCSMPTPDARHGCCCQKDEAYASEGDPCSKSVCRPP